MAADHPIILSASRRTDIPGCYTPWFLAQIEQGWFDVTNPYTRQERRVSTGTKDVHSIVFWSKNYGPFLDLCAHRLLTEKGYSLFFNFTINSAEPLLEPKVPLLDQRLAQARQLIEAFGPESLYWRFDPICFYRTPEGVRQNNLNDFLSIARFLSRLGVRRCVTSFYDNYRKIQYRLNRLEKTGCRVPRFFEPNDEMRLRIIQRMEKTLKQLNMDLFLCCEKPLFDEISEKTDVRENACIDGQRLKKLFGGTPDTGRDRGQRSKHGCRCTKSVDIGSYQDHPCGHNCLFCYANPLTDVPQTKKSCESKILT